MSVLFNEVSSAITCGRILIVDDDPVVAGMLGASLSSSGHEVVETDSGESALKSLTEMAKELLPDVVILDIELGEGIDGYETCQRLRAIDSLSEIPVIFLSSHDGLDDRLRAYDAGGNDFTAKPFSPDEILRKVSVSIKHKRQAEIKVTEGRSAFNTAMTAMTSLGESGVTLNFSRNALGCQTLSALARLTIDSMQTFGLESHVQLRTPTIKLTQTAQGAASPLEESVVDKVNSMGRIFSFGRRLIVNYPCISILVQSMPIENDDLCGRIRDHVAMIAEAAELAVDNINLRIEAINRAQELRSLSDSASKAVDELRSNYRELQMATRLELDTMSHRIEGMYVHLGLSNKQEFTISDTVRDSVENVLTLFEQSSELDHKFAGIVTSLSKVSNYKVPQEDALATPIDLW